MRTAIAVVLVICGTFLITLPPLSDYLYTQAHAQLLLNRPDIQSLRMPGRLGDSYRLGCYVLGMAMIVTAVAASLAAGRREGVRLEASSAAD